MSQRLTVGPRKATSTQRSYINHSELNENFMPCSIRETIHTHSATCLTTLLLFWHVNGSGRNWKRTSKITQFVHFTFQGRLQRCPDDVSHYRSWIQLREHHLSGRSRRKCHTASAAVFLCDRIVVDFNGLNLTIPFAHFEQKLLVHIVVESRE